MRLLLALIAFNLIVIVHELGHFIVARLAGIKVLEFSLFIGPRLFGFKRGETEYSLRLIPALAYVKLEGEDEASESERSFSKKSVPARMATIVAGPLANIVVAVLVLLVGYSIAGYDTTRINTVVKDSPAYSAGLRPGDEIISYDQKRIYQPMDISMFLYSSDGNPATVEVLRDNQKIRMEITPQKIPAQNRYILGFTAKAADGPDSNIVAAVDPNSPAGKGGLLPDDRIVEINGGKVASRQEISSLLNENKDKPVEVTVVRDGSNQVLTMTPMLQKTPEQYYLGFDFTSEKGNIFQVIGRSITNSYSITRMEIYSIGWLIRGKVPLDQMAGPVGIVSAINTVVQQSPTALMVVLDLLKMVALISIGLGITNLLPIPPADGSKLVLLMVEGIRKKPLPMEKEGLIMMIGFVVMLTLFVLLTFNDIMRLLTGG
ncbi:MAG: RIP metalloprotease RseP [Clostridiales bacterium]|jgi:regulator of sigma E protease|nr:RIP metalloprotease RseP [Eubacteriales bacterium]MDH7564899.1 RIP metalloprotease RseP [Clostridiales bacterium]